MSRLRHRCLWAYATIVKLLRRQQRLLLLLLLLL